jgi:glutathione S-transferase
MLPELIHPREQTVSRPRLYVFTISHYCEKARWALEYKGIDFELVTVLPGPHFRTIPKLAGSSRVPVLVDGDEVWQDSTPLLNYLDERYPNAPLTPVEPEARQQVAEWEQLFETELGDTVRRYLYSHAFTDSRFVFPLYVQNGPWWARPFYTVMLPAVFKAVKRMYKITPDVVRDDLRRLYALFERTDARYAEHRFLVGNEFTRADLTLAALAAPLLRPPEHPARWAKPELTPPALVEETRALLASRTAERIRELYREHRAPN